MDNEKIIVENNKPPEGYNPIAEIRGALFHNITVPFNGAPIWCYVTCLNMIQIKSCGNLSCLYLPKEESEEKKDFSLIEMIEIKNAQEALVKLTLVKPSFDEIIGMITNENFLISEKRRELEKINEEIKNLPSGKQKKELEKMAEKIEFYLGFLLPDDTMAFLTAWALGVEITDVKKLNRSILLDAAIMASNGRDNPTDHLSGVFTDFQKDDINRNAWYIYNQFIEDKKREKELNKNGYKWYGGKGRK